MERNFTLSNEFLEGQQPDTAVLPRNDLFPQLMMQASEMNYKRNQDEYERKKQETADKLANLDFNTAGVWQQDLPHINKGVNDFVDWIKKNPKALVMSPENLDLNLEMKKMQNDLYYVIDKSKTDKTWDSEHKDFYNKNSDKWRSTSNDELFNQFEKEPTSLDDIKNRRHIDLQQPIKYNWAASQENINGLVGKEINLSESNSTGNQTQQQKITETPIAKTFGVTDNMFNSEADNFRGGFYEPTKQSNPNYPVEIYDEDNPKYETVVEKGVTKTKLVPNAVKVISDPSVTMQDVYRSVHIPFTYSKVMENTLQGAEGSLASGGSSGNTEKPSKITWVVDGLVDIKKGTGQSTEDVKSSEGNTVKFSKMFEGGVINNPINNEPQTIASISHKGGKTYVTFKEEMSSTGNAPLRQIDNEWNQIVIPIIQDKYGDNALEELKQYAINQGVADVLGIPTLNAPTQSSGTQQQGGVKPKEDFRKKYNY